MPPAVVAEGQAEAAAAAADGSGAWRLLRTKRAGKSCCAGYPYCEAAKGRRVD